MDVAFADDQMRARTAHAAHSLAVLKQITLNLIRLDPTQRKGSIETRRLIAATSDIHAIALRVFDALRGNDGNGIVPADGYIAAMRGFVWRRATQNRSKRLDLTREKNRRHWNHGRRE